MGFVKYETAELNEIYEGLTAIAVVKGEFTSDLIGGQPGNEPGVRAFCEHHLHLAGDELEAAISRILKEEIREKRDATPENGEVKVAESYAVNVLRRDSHGFAWLGDWQVKAMLKCAASRLGIFKAKIGSKGDVAEMSRVVGHGPSAVGDEPKMIVLTDAAGQPHTERQFLRMQGRVNSPSGAVSIQTDCEFAPAGTRFEFAWRYPPKFLPAEQVARIIAASQVVGLGSARSMERGKFKVLELTVNDDTWKGAADAA